jgi:hypothetical protein
VSPAAVSTTAPAHVRQLDGSPLARHNCMAAVGAMALDAYTGGRIRVSGAEIRRRQSDQRGGIDLGDVAKAWSTFGERFTVRRVAWSKVLELARSGVAIPVDYGKVGRYSSQPSFTEGHALYLQGVSGGRDDVAVVVYDPLAPGPKTWPADVVKRAWAPYGTAGWGDGVSTGGKLDAWAGIVSFPVGHVITEADVETMIRALSAAGMLGGPGTLGIPETITRGVLRTAIGKPWSTALQADLQARFRLASTLAGSTIGDPLGALAGVVLGAGARIAALAGIVLLGLLGVWLLFREGGTTVIVRGVKGG